VIRAARNLAVLLSAAAQVACATRGTSGYDTLTNVKSICDVPFEEGTIVQVSANFDGDRYHSDGLFDSGCRGIYWVADWTDDFEGKYAKRLELGNAIVIGPFSRYRLEVEGRLFLTHEGKPAIEFQKLSKSERIAR
jgi:hypothetical protein